MKPIVWSTKKNELLKTTRGVRFEDVVFHMAAGDLVDTFEQPDQRRHPGQRIHAVAIEEYVYLVQFVETEEEVSLKTIIPSRKATKRCKGETEAPEPVCTLIEHRRCHRASRLCPVR